MLYFVAWFDYNIYIQLSSKDKPSSTVDYGGNCSKGLSFTRMAAQTLIEGYHHQVVEGMAIACE